MEDLLRNIVRSEVEAVLQRDAELEPALLTAAAASRYLSMGRSTLMRRTEIPSRLVDGRRYWARADLDAWVEQLPRSA